MYIAYLINRRDSEHHELLQDSRICYMISLDTYSGLIIYNEDQLPVINDNVKSAILHTFNLSKFPTYSIYIEPVEADQYDIYYNLVKDGDNDSPDDEYFFLIKDANFVNYPLLSSIGDKDQQSEQDYENQIIIANEYTNDQPAYDCKLSIPPNIKAISDLKYPIKKYENLCTVDRGTKSIIKQLVKDKNRDSIVGEYDVHMEWFDSKGDIHQPKYFFDKLAKISITSKPLKIILIDSIASDYGGVTRSVFTKAGEYIKSMLVKSSESGRYNFHTGDNLSTKFILNMRHVMKLAISQGAYLDIPLSHGIIYSIQEGIDDGMHLHELMYVYSLDYGNEALVEVLRYITDEYITHLPDLEPVVYGVAGKRQVDGTVGNRDRITWLYRYMQTLVYNNAHAAMDVFLHLGEDRWDEPILRQAVKTSSIVDLADIFGKVDSAGEVIETINRARVNAGPALEHHSKEYLIQYIKQSPEKAKDLLYFITAARNPDVDIVINVYHNQRLPSASTCANTLSLYAYTDYNQFKEQMDMAIATDEFGYA